MVAEMLKVKHKLLARQIKKMLGESELDNPKIVEFLNVINDTYQEFEEERSLIERSMELSSQELTDSLETMRQQKTELSEAYDVLRSTQVQLAETERIAEMRTEMHRAIEEKNGELLASEEELRQKNEELQASEEELKQTIEEMHSIQERLQDQKEFLEQTVLELKNTQNQLIQSEKMAALGQLVANIAHEINTPLGAISSSIKYIYHGLQTSIPELTHFLRTLSPADTALFQQFVTEASQQTQMLSTREERQIKRGLREHLEAENVEDIDWVADTLVDARMHESIASYLPIIQNTKALDLAYRLASLQRSANTIQTATQKVSKIIFALKNFSRHDDSDMMTSADLHETLETVLTIYQNQIRRGIEVVRQFEPIPAMMCYPDELMQVWTNILHNALQAMDNNGTVIITTHFDTDHKKIIVSLADTGKGIPTAIQDKIFNAFFTTKKIGEGSGLGLDIARKIVEKHQGNIHFKSEEGKGTTFFVELPFVEAVEE
jgi:signal transduction histidine kinase